MLRPITVARIELIIAEAKLLLAEQNGWSDDHRRSINKIASEANKAASEINKGDMAGDR